MIGTPALLAPRGALPLALCLVVACHSAGSGGSAADASSDDSSDSSAGVCPCLASNDNATIAIPCDDAVCSDGNLFVCSYGTLIPFGTCSDDGGDDADADDASSDCVPQCNDIVCGNDDECGGSCGCAAGMACVAGECGNGCPQQVGDVCALDGGGASGDGLCCQSGYSCAPREGGVSTCCTVTSGDGGGGGLCLQDTDCCAYPLVGCQGSVCQ